MQLLRKTAPSRPKATYESQTHKEMQPGRIKCDNIDFTEIQSWFLSNNPFTHGEHIACLDSELMDESNQLNCDRSEIGASMQRALNLTAVNLREKIK